MAVVAAEWPLELLLLPVDEVEADFRVLLPWSVVGGGWGVAIPVGLWAGVTEMGVDPISMVLGDEREERGVSIVGGMSEIVRLEGVWGSVPKREKKRITIFNYI